MEKNKLNTGANAIKGIMSMKNVSVSELARLMSEKGLNIEPRILSGKLNRDTFSLNEYVIIADILGCDVKTISRDNTITIQNEYNIEKELIKKRNSAKPKGKKKKGEEAEEVQ